MPEWVTILDENDEPCQATLELRGRRLIAVKEDGVLVLPGAFMVLSDTGSALLTAAEERIK